MNGTRQALVSRWARRYALVSALFLVGWQVGVVAGIPRRTEVVLALYGFVLHTVFGKAYSLVPTYFDSELAAPRAPAVQFPLTVLGVVGMAVAAHPAGPVGLATPAATLWSLGVCVFLGTLLWTVRGNLTGRETATGAHNAHRRPVDRLANAFVPVALGYLLLGTYSTLALHTGLPALVTGPAQVTHLLAAGTAGVLVFALGFRLLPRFLTAQPPRALVAVVLSTGAVGPALLATGLYTSWQGVAAVVESVAVVGFAVGVWLLFARAKRRRVGSYGVVAGALAGVVGVAIGLSFVLWSTDPALVRTHLRVNLLGFLGLTILGIAYQFYPPAAGRWPGSTDRTALASLGCIVAGLALQLFGPVGGLPVLQPLGTGVALAGGLLYGYLLGAVFAGR